VFVSKPIDVGVALPSYPEGSQLFHHIAMFRFKDDVSDAVVAGIREDLLTLPDKLAAIRTYQVGRDAAVSEGAWDLVVVGGFDDEAGYQAYSAHPDHLVIVERIRKLITDRASLQSRELAYMPVTAMPG
jgi:hypothetical protein